MDSTRRARDVTAALWLIAIAGVALMAYQRYKGLVATTPSDLGHIGGDFWGYLHATHRLSEGHNPYDFAGSFRGFYIYSPLVAVALLPFIHASVGHLWHAWTALSIIGLVLFGGLVTLVEARRLTSWRLPVLFGIASFTVLQFGQTGVELYYGNTEPFVLVALATSVLAAESGWAATSGALMGVGGLIKTWPAAAALATLRRGYVKRGRTLVAFAVTFAFIVVVCLSLGGASGLRDFVRATFGARAQPILSYSVWATPFQLFAHSGIARPLFVSSPLRYLLTLVLVAVVIGLLVLALRWGDSSVLAFWNVFACVVLLVPVSHSDYTLYLLPLLWIWIARWLRDPRLGGLTSAVMASLGLWWLVSSYNWYYGLPTESALRLSIVFFANLAAVTVSILGDHFVRLSDASEQSSIHAVDRVAPAWS